MNKNIFMIANSLFMEYLFASYKYYHLDEDSGITNHTFDFLCNKMLQHYEIFEQLPLWKEMNMTRDVLECGTGCQLPFNHKVFGIIEEILRRH